MRTLSFVLHAALVALAAATAAGCTRAAAREAIPPQPVKAAEVTMAATPTGVRYSATIEPAQQVTLSFKASGYVDAVGAAHHTRRRPSHRAAGRPRVARPGAGGACARANTASA
jgi:hypothetical protein